MLIRKQMIFKKIKRWIKGYMSVQLINATGKDKFPEIYLRVGDTLHIKDGTDTEFIEIEMLRHKKLVITVIPDSLRIIDKALVAQS